MRKAARYVRSHLSETIRLADVSRHVDLSPNYFSRIFASEMGTPFVSYVTAARMDRAKELLRSTNLPVTEIAAEVGVPDHSYFTKLFRTTTGRTPSVFRQGGEGPPVGPPGEMRNV
jgi:two-component system response regulator YesN